MSFDLISGHYYPDHLKEISFYVFFILAFLVVIKIFQVARMYKTSKKKAYLSSKREMQNSFFILNSTKKNWFVELLTTARVGLVSIACYIGLFYDSSQVLFWFYGLIPVLIVIGLSYFLDRLYRRIDG